ncbi:MAG TPA: hypothetical protein VFD15_00585 [Clostridia bacterium]|nr:hypothetical protein [Clostridia bacterium]
MILPEMRKRAAGRCKDCKFMVSIAGKREKRRGCVASIKRYSLHNHGVPEVIDAIEVIRLVGTEGLQEVLKQGDPHKEACEFFRHK